MNRLVMQDEGFGPVELTPGKFIKYKILPEGEGDQISVFRGG